MRILVTGGTGFVGSHTVAALVDAGHEVRLLVRSPGRVEPALAPFGVAKRVAVTEGDVTDRASVEAALQDADALLHAANVYSLDARDAETMRRVNERGTELVLDAARRAGCDPIVHVSSMVVFVGSDAEVISEESEVGAPEDVYGATKVTAELIARRRQAEGAPVVTTYPGAVFGPHDPHLGESSTILLELLAGRLPLFPKGAFNIVDVRDVARLHAAVMQPGRGPRRYLAAGERVPMRDLVAIVRGHTGRPRFATTIPDGLALMTGRLAARLQARLPFRLPVHLGGVETILSDLHAAPSAATSELGIGFRGAEEAIVDNLRWLVDAGHLPRSRAGSLAA